ncbi:MAG: DNA polymerase IV [Prevotellaceae bacterium]|jgi:DNA polymerase-4|nr:DNA polymerase IV [Prevotellaceae bacterium]
MRKIIHIDMDAFYASIEQRDNPEYRGKPLAVGYAGERGVVATASYEARKYGIRSAMPSKTALAKCPQLIFAKPRFEIYKEVSLQIRNIFFDYTDLVEPLSLDEAYLDVTVNHMQMPSATIVAREIKKRIKEATGLTASAGVSVNKFLAKIASDYNKPDGLFVITEKEAEAFVEQLEIERFWGVGKVTAERMHKLGINTGADLKRLSESELVMHFGKAGHSYYQNARAIDNRQVVPDRIRKSVGAEHTFLTDINDIAELATHLREIADEVWRRTSQRNFYGRTVTLKIKYSDFKQITRSKTLNGFVNEFNLLWTAALELLNTVDLSDKRVRLMGLTVSNIQDIEQPKTYQLKLDF